MPKNSTPIKAVSEKQVRQSGDMKSWELIFDPTTEEALRYPIGGRWDFYNLKESVACLNTGMIFQNVFTLTLKRVESIKFGIKGDRFENGLRSYVRKDLQALLKKEGVNFKIPERTATSSRSKKRARLEEGYEETRANYG